MSKEINPNRAFAAVLAESGLSHKRLARHVVEASRRRGKQQLHTDHVAVTRWLDGVQPKAEAAECLAAVLSESLRRAITPASLGFTNAERGSAETPTVGGEVSYPVDSESATDSLRSVATADLEDQGVERLQAWDRHAAPGVISGYLFGDPGWLGLDDGGDQPVDATAIRRTTASLMELDFKVGGGHTRQLLLFYFRSQVLPLFAKLPRGAARRDLLSATAELSQMLGWSAYDSGRHGAAQRYFSYGLRLARDADDHLLGARLLSNLSHQANYLGHFTDAAQLARAAQSAAATVPSPATMSMLCAMEARALASLGDSPGCAGALQRAETAFDSGSHDSDPEWIGYFDRTELAGEYAHCFRDLRRPDETRHFAGLAIQPLDTPPRTRAFIGLVTAMGALHGGELDDAVTTAREAVVLAGALESTRYRRYVSDFVDAVVAQHPRDPRVVDLVALTAPLIPQQRTG